MDLLFRAVFPVPEVINFNRIDYSAYVFTEGVTRISKLSHDSFLWISDPDGVEFVHALNLYGFRDREWIVTKTNERVIFVGDSFVEGFMAQAEESIPRGFERAAHRAGLPLDVMNMGVGATGLRQYVYLLRDAVPLFKPEHVVLVLYENDFPPLDFDPAWFENCLVPKYRNLFAPRIYNVLSRAWRGEHLAMAWMRPPFQFWAPVPSPTNIWTQREAEFAPYVDPKMAAIMKAGRFNPMQVNEVNSNAYTRVQPADIRPHLQAIRSFLEGHDATLLVCYIPNRHQVSDHYMQFAKTYSLDTGIVSHRAPAFQLHRRHFQEVCQELGLSCLDLTPPIQEKEDRGEHLYWDYDEHLKGAAYLHLGETIFKTWKSRR